MAEDAVDLACVNGRVPEALPCQTSHMPLLGAHGYDPALFTEVAQNYTVPHRPGAIDTRVAKHLAGCQCVTCACVLSCPQIIAVLMLFLLVTETWCPPRLLLLDTCLLSTFFLLC